MGKLRLSSHIFKWAEPRYNAKSISETQYLSASVSISWSSAEPLHTPCFVFRRLIGGVFAAKSGRLGCLNFVLLFGRHYIIKNYRKYEYSNTFTYTQCFFSFLQFLHWDLVHVKRNTQILRTQCDAFVYPCNQHPEHDWRVPVCE